jgi:serine/threonine-protein kinase
MQLAPGAMVTPNVRLVRPLRSGGMGHVWLADHIGLHLPVAVKFIADKLALDDPAVRARFELEARTAARIKSVHVVQTHDCGIMADGTPYIVMELLEGESLQERLDREGVLSLPDTVRVLGQVAMALSRAHKLNIVHRDIKPANIFLCPTDEGLLVKVLDFGLAQAFRPADLPGGVPTGDAEPSAASTSPEPGPADVMVGTLPFLRPETLAGEQRESHHADLWALGVVAYRCLVGRLPFTGSTPGLLCLSVMTGEFPAPSALRAELSRSVDAWFVRAFHCEQERRFQSAKEMTFALAATCPSSFPFAMLEDDSQSFTGMNSLAALRAGGAHQLGTLESGPTVLPPLGERSRRRTWLAAVVGVVIVAAGVAAVVLVLALGSEPDEDAPSRPSVGAGTASHEPGGEQSREPPDRLASAAPSASSSTPSTDAGTPPVALPGVGATQGRPAPKSQPTGRGRREDYGF